MGKSKRKREEGRARIQQSARRRFNSKWPKSLTQQGTHINLAIDYTVEGLGPYDHLGGPGFMLNGSVYGPSDVQIGTRMVVHLPECPRNDSLEYEPLVDLIGVDSFQITYQCPACGQNAGPAMRDVNLVLDEAVSEQPLTPPDDPPTGGLPDTEFIYTVNDDR